MGQIVLGGGCQGSGPAERPAGQGGPTVRLPSSSRQETGWPGWPTDEPNKMTTYESPHCSQLSGFRSAEGASSRPFCQSGGLPGLPGSCRDED